MTRIIFIGDVHGCLIELMALVDKLDLRRSDRIVFLGDLVDKGPDSVDVVRYVYDLRANHDVTCLMGNHEKKWVRRGYFSDPTSAAAYNAVSWPTLVAEPKLTSDEFTWLRSLPLFVRVEGMFAVHGGVYPQLYKDLGELRDEDAHGLWLGGKRSKQLEKMCHTRTVDTDGDFVSLKDAVDGSAHWSDVYDGRDGFAFYGHDPFRTVRRSANTTGLDTGCVYGGYLTAAIVTKRSSTWRALELVSVPAAKAYADHPDFAAL